MDTPKHVRVDGTLSARDAAPTVHPAIPITATIPEFRRISGISRSRIYELLDAGELQSVHIGVRRLIIIQSYLDLIERQHSKVQK
jgi:predicted DNA-binding transcriptional regulator AlpA